MKYLARIREVSFYELVVEANSIKQCYAQIQEYLRKNPHLPLSGAVGFRYEIESINQGHPDEYPKIKRKPVRHKRSSRLESERVEI